MEQWGGEGAKHEGGRRGASGSAILIAFAEQAWLGGGTAAAVGGGPTGPFLPSLCWQH